MHKLLARQLRAAAKNEGGVDTEALIAIIDQAYAEFDRERRLNDRAAKLMEDELMEANEQARREHDTVLATILESASDGMLVTRSGIVETANAAAEQQFGAAQGALAGHAIGDLMGPAAAATARGEDAAGASQLREDSALRLDGHRFPVEFSVDALGATGIRRQLWIVRDISERIRAQREIMESRMRFQDFAEASSDCFWEMDETLTHVEVTSSTNSEHASCLASLLTPRPDGSAPKGIDTAAWELMRRNLVARQHFRVIHVTIKKRDGEIVHLSLSGKPVFDLDGQFRGYRGTGRDVTREVEAHEAAGRAERRMIVAMDAAPNALALVDPAMCFVAGNSALRSLAPHIGESLSPGDSFPGFLARALTTDGTLDDGATPADFMRNLIDSGVTREIGVRGQWLLIAARGLSDGGAVVTFSDVTALKEREREFSEAKRAAESANHLKSQFLATMSHELRTPLNAILGFSEVIRDQVFGENPDAWGNYAQYASSIHASGRHLLALISEILDLSKIEAGSYVLDIEKVEMRQIVGEAAAIMAANAERAGIDIETHIPDTPVFVSGDDRALRQIALNLFSNAVKFTPKGGAVSVGLKTDGDAVVFAVEDNGIGIATEHLDVVFEPFRQVDSSVRRRHEGTGLGLAITKRLVELHHGTVRLTSELAVGTKVEVRLPLHAAGANSLVPDKAVA